MSLKIQKFVAPRLKFSAVLLFLCGFTATSFAQPGTKLSFEVSAPNPSNHLYHVQLNYAQLTKATLRFRMCAWTPGFYEIEDFGTAVSNFRATDKSGKALPWKKTTDSTWNVQANGKSGVVLNYDVKANNPFIANANLDEHYGYFVPGAICMYLNEALQQPLTVHIKPYQGWPQTIATGLDPVPGRANT